MLYLLFVLIAAVATLAILFVAARKGTAIIPKVNIFKPCEEEITPYQGGSLILLTLICFAALCAIQISLYINTSLINFVKLFGLAVIVICAGVIDSKRRIIPNALIIAGLVFRAAIYLYEILLSDADIKAILINDLLGFALGFVLLGAVSLLSKGALGFGDAKLFGIIGLTCGSFGTYSTLLLSLIFSVVFSLLGMARKKMGRKDAFPFGPFIAAAYVVVLLLTSY